MKSIVKASIIIKDDFDNILIIQRKTKKNEPKLWTFVTCDIKQGVLSENAILKQINKQLKVTIFDLESIYNISLNDNEVKEVFTGIIRECIVTHNEISKIHWINKKDIFNYEFTEEDTDLVNLFRE